MQLTLAALVAYAALGCESGGVGAPCIPEEEYKQNFPGFAVPEVNVESRSFQCETRVCLVNHFQGRVSCPYGQADPEGGSLSVDDRARCRVPGSNGQTCVTPDGNVAECGSPNTRNVDEITVPVDPQLVFRNADDAVYCSCRCKGPDANARYCECPSGFVCEELVRDIGVTGRGQLIGSYCIKPGTLYDPVHPPPPYQCTIPEGDDNRYVPDDQSPNRRKVGDTCGQTNNCPAGVDAPCAANPPL